MKFLTASMLILAVFPLVVDAKRRRVPFMIFPLTKSNSGLVTVKPARSKSECSVICLNDPDCLSASYCKNLDGSTCQLSSFYAYGTCTGHSADDDCTQTAMVSPCENGGTFCTQNRTCHCLEGFLGDYCQRRYRDCLETPLGNAEYLIQPLESDYIFQWPCATSSTKYTHVSEYHFLWDSNYTLTWEQMKQGIPKIASLYYFIGLEALHHLTKQGVYDLFFKMIVLGNDSGQVIYKNFRIDSEAEGYACHWDNVISTNDKYLDGFGAVGDAIKSLNGARFGTFDNDVTDCARIENVAWWYNPIGCSMMKFAPDGMFWPVNRTGTVEMDIIDITLMGLLNVNWYLEDDLIL